MNATDARAQWSHVLHQVFRKENRVVVEKSGIPVAAIVSADDLERLTRLGEERDRGFAAMERISRAFADVPVDELEQAVEAALCQRGARNGVGRARPLTEADILLTEPVLPDDETADGMIATVRRWRREGGHA